MSTNTVDISAKIANMLASVTGIQDVYEYEPDKPTNGRYPFISVTPLSFEGEFADTQRNLRTYEFSIKVYQERTEAAFGNQKAERLMREIVDEILTIFDNDTRLGGTVKWATPARGDLTYDPREVGDVRVAEIIIECHSIVDSIT